MKITKEVIPHIEKAMGFILYEQQRDYLLCKGYMKSGRATGKTVAHCIKLALSDGGPLNMKEAYEFSDYGDGSRRYALSFYRHEFTRVRNRLKDYGFPVRRVV